MNIILFFKKFTIKFTISKSLLMLSLLLCHACATLLLLYNVWNQASPFLPLLFNKRGPSLARMNISPHSILSVFFLADKKLCSGQSMETWQEYNPPPRFMLWVSGEASTAHPSLADPSIISTSWWPSRTPPVLPTALLRGHTTPCCSSRTSFLALGICSILGYVLYFTLGYPSPGYEHVAVRFQTPHVACLAVSSFFLLDGTSIH